MIYLLMFQRSCLETKSKRISTFYEVMENWGLSIINPRGFGLMETSFLRNFKSNFPLRIWKSHFCRFAHQTTFSSLYASIHNYLPILMSNPQLYKSSVKNPCSWAVRNPWICGFLTDSSPIAKRDRYIIEGGWDGFLSEWEQVLWITVLLLPWKRWTGDTGLLFFFLINLEAITY